MPAYPSDCDTFLFHFLAGSSLARSKSRMSTCPHTVTEEFAFEFYAIIDFYISICFGSCLFPRLASIFYLGFEAVASDPLLSLKCLAGSFLIDY